MHKLAHDNNNDSGGVLSEGSLMMNKLIGRPRLASLGLAFVVGLSLSPLANANQRDQYKRIYDRLAGVPPTPQAMADMVTAGNLGAAADIAMQNPNFYNVTLKNFATPWTNEAQTQFDDLNDYSATVIGMIRDDVDFRKVLSGNIIYIGDITHINAGVPAASATPPYSNTDNAHYKSLEARNINLGDPLNLVQRTQTEVTGLTAEATAGVITTRAAARAFFIDGTNRAMFRFTMINHMCYDMEQIKDNTRTADRVRQDVSRSPGGDSRLFLNNCLGCHSGMDPMVQAFANYEWDYKDNDPNTTDDPDKGQLLYTPGVVQDKYHINANNFKGGYFTPDSGWSNYWRHGPNAWLGWGDSPSPLTEFQQLVSVDSKGISSGTGAKSLGLELAHSDAFARCQVKKVFKTVCLRSPNSSDTTQFDQMVNSFKADYKMKGAFRRAAVYCSGN